MAETILKRQREEETETAAFEETKRHKSYNDILSLLDSEEDEPNEDLSSLINTLQQEITPEVVVFEESKTENDQNALGNHHGPASSSSSSSYSSESSCSKEDDKDRVIRHLLEASDDELGIPNMEVGSSNTTSTVSGSIDDYGEVGFDGGDNGNGNGNGNIDFALCDGLWALEDEAANYYTLLQSELFM